MVSHDKMELEAWGVPRCRTGQDLGASLADGVRLALLGEKLLSATEAHGEQSGLSRDEDSQAGNSAIVPFQMARRMLRYPAGTRSIRSRNVGAALELLRRAGVNTGSVAVPSARLRSMRQRKGAAPDAALAQAVAEGSPEASVSLLWAALQRAADLEQGPSAGLVPGQSSRASRWASAASLHSLADEIEALCRADPTGTASRFAQPWLQRALSSSSSTSTSSSPLPSIASSDRVSSSATDSRQLQVGVSGPDAGCLVMAWLVASAGPALRSVDVPGIETGTGTGSSGKGVDASHAIDVIASPGMTAAGAAAILCTDGRALALALHRYHPALLPRCLALGAGVGVTGGDGGGGLSEAAVRERRIAVQRAVQALDGPPLPLPPTEAIRAAAAAVAAASQSSSSPSSPSGRIGQGKGVSFGSPVAGKAILACGRLLWALLAPIARRSRAAMLLQRAWRATARRWARSGLHAASATERRAVAGRILASWCRSAMHRRALVQHLASQRVLRGVSAKVQQARNRATGVSASAAAPVHVEAAQPPHVPRGRRSGRGSRRVLGHSARAVHSSSTSTSGTAPPSLPVDVGGAVARARRAAEASEQAS